MRSTLGQFIANRGPTGAPGHHNLRASAAGCQPLNGVSENHNWISDIVQPRRGDISKPMHPVVILFLLVLVGCAPTRQTNLVQDHKSDPKYQETKRLAGDINDCFVRESQSKSTADSDLNTAVFTVLTRCDAQRKRLKDFQAGNDAPRIQRLERSWTRGDYDDFETVKQMILIVRTPPQ